MPRSPQRPRRTSVPGSYFGYALEATRVLMRLLFGGPGTVVSLESFADVGVSVRGRRMIAEEDKASGSRNPVANLSPELWKSLGNWAEAINAGTLDPAVTRFVLYTSKPCNGRLIGALASAGTDGQAHKALTLLKKIGAAAQGDVRPHTTRVFRCPDSRLRQMIINLSYETGSGHSIDDAKAALRTRIFQAEHLDDLLESLLGWLKTRIDPAVEQNRPANVTYEEFEAEARSVLVKLDQLQILVSFAKDPSERDVRLHLKTKTYVRQLGLIEQDDGTKLRAVDDFLRAQADRIEWAARGRVHSSSLKTLQDELGQAWSHLRTRVQIQAAGHSEVARGALLYAECCLHRIRLQGAEPPDHFVRGSFHALSDDRRVGWHPKYEELLQEEGS